MLTGPRSAYTKEKYLSVTSNFYLGNVTYVQLYMFCTTVLHYGRDGSNRIYGKMTYGIYTYIRIYTYILVYIHILYGSMKKKEVSEQEGVVLMVNAERGLSKSSPISKRTVNDILVEEFVLPNVIF